MMHNRFKSVEYLKTLVYDLTKFTTERDHIQKVIEKCFWLFGEQYNLVSADATFEKALAEYVYILDGKDKKEKLKYQIQNTTDDQIYFFVGRMW